MMQTTSQTEDADLVDSELFLAGTRIGLVVGLQRDPVSQRVRRIVTSYGSLGRQVAVPIDWVMRRGRGMLVLGVDVRLLDDLPDHLDAWQGTPLQPPPGPRRPAASRP